MLQIRFTSVWKLHRISVARRLASHPSPLSISPISSGPASNLENRALPFTMSIRDPSGISKNPHKTRPFHAHCQQRTKDASSHRNMCTAALPVDRFDSIQLVSSVPGRRPKSTTDQGMAAVSAGCVTFTEPWDNNSAHVVVLATWDGGAIGHSDNSQCETERPSEHVS